MEKICNTCGESKSLSEFFKKKTNKDGLENQCKKCKNEKRNNRHKHICQQCGKEFTSGDKNSKFCSNECCGKSRITQVEFNCDYCGKPSSDKRSHYELKNRHYCSTDCMHKHQSELWSGVGSPLYNRIKVKCDYCGKEIEIINFEYSKAENHYCSRDCMGKYRSEIYRGENHPRWNFELTQEEREQERNYPEYIDFIKKVYERDNYTCQCCGKLGESDLNAHHLDGYNWCKERRTDINNGVTLCEDCHKEFHKEYGKGNNTKEQFKEFINKKVS